MERQQQEQRRLIEKLLSNNNSNNNNTSSIPDPDQDDFEVAFKNFLASYQRISSQDRPTKMRRAILNNPQVQNQDIVEMITHAVNILSEPTTTTPSNNHHSSHHCGELDLLGSVDLSSSDLLENPNSSSWESLYSDLLTPSSGTDLSSEL